MRRALSVSTLSLALVASAGAALASGAHSADDPMGEPMIFWGAGAEVDGTDAGWLDGGDGTLITWDAYAWAGGDDVKLRLEAEGEAFDGDIDDAELRAFLSWNIAEFWDLQTGVRVDLEPDDLVWGAIGVHGLAPYFFETDAHLFVSHDGDASIRLEQSIDLALTQDLFLKPHVEINAFAGDVQDLGAGGGISDVEAGLQLRYEFSRKFAPYVDLIYERDLGETAIITRAAGEDVERVTARIGFRIRL